MTAKLNRREFISGLAASSGLAAVSCRSWRSGVGASTSRPARFLFVTQGKTAMMNADGTGLRYFDFEVPNQVT
jgi:hypothetical protein